jgi:hypothetical protein
MTWKWEQVAVLNAINYLQKLQASGVEDCDQIVQGLQDCLAPKARAERIRRLQELDTMDANGEKPSGIIPR